MKIVVLLSFKRETKSGIIVFSDNVYQKMSTDPVFASLKPDVDALKPIIETYRTAFNNVSTGGDAEKDKRDDAYDVLIEALTMLTMKVNILAKGDIRIGKASGFDTPTESQSIDYLLAPTGFKFVNIDIPGSYKIKWDEIIGANQYYVEHRPKGTDKWEKCGTPSARSMTFKNVPLGSCIEYRFHGMGNKNLISPWSAILEVWVN